MPPKKTTPATKGAVKKPAAKPAPTKGKPAAKKPAAKEEKKEEPAKAEAPKVEAKRKVINKKQIAKVLVEDDDKDIRSHGKAALVVDDENHIAMRFLPYSGANVLEAMSPGQMDPERIRMAVVGAVRHGKPMALDFGDCGPDMLCALESKFDEVQPGLLTKCMNREVCKRDAYESLVKDDDDDNYKVASYMDFEEEISAKFIFEVVMKKPDEKEYPEGYPKDFTDKFYTISVE